MSQIRLRTTKPPPEQADADAATISFTLPENQEIWPNIDGGVNNAVLLSWNNNDASNKYQILIDNAATIATLNIGSATVLAGSNSNSGSLPRVINFDFLPLTNQTTLGTAADPATNGYLLSITTRAAGADISYDHPNVADDSDFKHYRTYTVSGVISPRN